jgi:hypothetical protein
VYLSVNIFDPTRGYIADACSYPAVSTLQRHKLKGPFTPVTPETFAIWLKQRADKKSAEAEAREKAKVTQRAAGRVNGMSGRHMFEFGGIQDEEVRIWVSFGVNSSRIGWLIVAISICSRLQDGDDEDWDIQRYLADRDKDARAESAADEDEDQYRARRNGEEESEDGEGREGDDGQGDEDDEDGGEKQANGNDAAGNGAASRTGKESGLADDEVQEAVDKLEKVRVAT